MKIGFIGIGSMGAAMVPHLVQAKHEVRVWNRTADAAKELAAKVPVLTVADSPVAAFDSDVVLSILANDAAVRSVVLESGALAKAGKREGGCVHAMMATISPALVQELIAAHAEAGVGYVSAPVFGVPAAAAKAQLNILLAGAPDAAARVQPVLALLGQKVWPLGDDPVRANVAKIAGNMMLTLAMEAMGEATALTESYGVSAKDFLDIVTSTIFASPSYQRYGGFIASKTYEPGFKLTLGLKDVNLALDAAKAKSVTLPSAEIVRQNMVAAVDRGHADKDWSIVAQEARRRAGLPDDEA
jgi:3-hydroxyisobutyrate dehydrogenase-like beta-hydroxyacid dehydrogenase